MNNKYSLPKDGGLIAESVPRDIIHRYEKILTRVYENEYEGVQYVADNIVKAIRTYNEQREKEETREAKRKELENEMGVLKWDMEQIYEEIKEEKKANGPDSKEVIAELNGQIADMNKRMKEIRNELYYL